jgi:ankyrin repeat protein
MIIIQKAADNAPKVSFAEHNNVVKAFSAQHPSYSLHIRRLPRAAWSNDNLLDAQRHHMISKRYPVDPIPITQEISQRFAIVEGLNQLAGCPIGSRMFRNVEMLLANKAEVDAKDILGETPLHNASFMGYKDAAELLLASKADVNAEDKYGETPLHQAAAKGQKDIVVLLLQRGGHE